MRAVATTVTIEYVYNRPLTRNIAEAHLIYTLQPSINCREEMGEAMRFLGPHQAPLSLRET